MPTEATKKIQAEFMEKAKKEGVVVYKNNIRNAKPLSEICGSIKTKYPTSSRELICGR